MRREFLTSLSTEWGLYEAVWYVYHIVAQSAMSVAKRQTSRGRKRRFLNRTKRFRKMDKEIFWNARLWHFDQSLAFSRYMYVLVLSHVCNKSIACIRLIYYCEKAKARGACEASRSFYSQPSRFVPVSESQTCLNSHSECCRVSVTKSLTVNSESV